jgi:hypothetical protein
MICAARYEELKTSSSFSKEIPIYKDVIPIPMVIKM